MKKDIFLLMTILAATTVFAQQKHYNLVIGTYTKSCESKGIYVYDFNTDNAEFKFKASTENVENPSFVSVSADNKKVYSVNEIGEKSSVSAFNYNAKNGKLDFINKQSSEGADPCYLINDNKNVIVANYSGGTISVFGKKSDGGISAAKQIIKHEGKSIDPKKRQESPHVHMVHFSPDKKFLIANDLGTDRVYLYEYNADAEKNVLQFKDTIPIKSGSGPRHLTFSPDGRYIYLLREFDGMVTVFDYFNGKFRRIQEISSVATDFKGVTGAADIHISSDGKFLYTTNRGDANTISTFAVDAKGKLSVKQIISTDGKNPRNFAIDPTGKFVLVGHQNTNDIIVFDRDPVNGTLKNSGKKLELCSPVCLVFTEQN